MAHRNHSNGNVTPEHQVSSITTTGTTTPKMPSFRVYVDMGTENFANGSVVYTSQVDSPKTCVDALKDDVHYRFDCRCGCGGGFAGYGRDIKASGKIGRPTPKVVTHAGFGIISATGTTNAINITCTTPVGASIIWDDQTKAESAEVVEKPLPFVSDRYLKKAVYSLSDDEIDEYHKNHPDPLQEKVFNLAERQPPGIGDVVYSLSTDEGPFTVIDYTQKSVSVDGANINVCHGVVRNDEGKLINIPLADLAIHYPARPKKTKLTGHWLWPVFVVVTASIIGSTLAIAQFAL